MLRSLAVSIGALILALNASPASAQMACGKHTEVVTLLEANHQERRSAMGLSANGKLIELYTSTDGGWTLLVTTPGGPTCLITAGRDWTDSQTAKQVLDQSH